MAGKTTANTATETKAPTKAPSGNLDLWNRLSQTDPSATKPFDNGRFKGTQVDPYYRYKLMTEVFGPIGKGWGYELTDPIFSGATVFIGAKAWYIDLDTKEKVWSSVQYGGDVLVKGAKATANDEALKMAVTDAVGKALSLIGVAADVYMGQFDDSKYREDMAVLHEMKKAWPDEKIIKFETDTIADIVQIGTVAEINTYYQRADFREDLRCVAIVDKPTKARIMDALSDRKRELVEAEEAERRATKTGKGQQPAATADDSEDQAGEDNDDTREIEREEDAADANRVDHLDKSLAKEEPEGQQQDEPAETRKPKQELVIDVTEHVKGQPKTLAVQEPDEENPDWERFARTALKIIQNFPSRAWGERWMKLNSGTIGRLEEQGVIMERDGVEYTGFQAAKWIDKAYDKRMNATPDSGTRRAEQAGAN